MQYQVSIPTLLDFFCQGKHQGFSEDDIQAAEKALGVTLPTVYRDFLKMYGLNSINDRHNHINRPPKGIATSYSYIQDALEDWEKDFKEAKELEQEDRYKDNDYWEKNERTNSGFKGCDYRTGRYSPRSNSRQLTVEFLSGLGRLVYH